MAEYARLIGMLDASKAHLGYSASKPFEITGLYSHGITNLSEQEFTESETSSTGCSPVPSSLIEAFELIADGGPLPSKSVETQSEDFKVGLNHVLSTLNVIFPPGAYHPSSTRHVRKFVPDLKNDLAIATSKRIFRAAKNHPELQTIALELSIPQNANMTGRLPVLTTSNLSPASATEQAATASPARGTAMLNSIFKSVRVPEFRFKWQFWAEKGQAASAPKPNSSDDFASRPKPLGDVIVSVKDFYQHFNNIPVESLKLRDSIHLFHAGVKPLWEDPRNTRGGAWYFRIGKDNAEQFWHEMCLLAVGDVLQGAVETKREGEFRFSAFIGPQDFTC